MIITLKEAYGNDDILKQFPKPDYTHISPKITVSDARWIDFDKIHIDEDEGNVARSDNEKEDLSSRVNELVQSFTAGVLLNQEIGLCNTEVLMRMVMSMKNHTNYFTLLEEV